MYKNNKSKRRGICVHKTIVLNVVFIAWCVCFLEMKIEVINSLFNSFLQSFKDCFKGGEQI